MLYPLGYAIWLSLYNYDIGSGARDFIVLSACDDVRPKKRAGGPVAKNQTELALFRREIVKEKLVKIGIV